MLFQIEGNKFRPVGNGTNKLRRGQKLYLVLFSDLSSMGRLGGGRYKIVKLSDDPATAVLKRHGDIPPGYTQAIPAYLVTA